MFNQHRFENLTSAQKLQWVQMS